MSVNTAHANDGVLIHSGEGILLFSENVTMDFSGQDADIFRGSKNGKIYLTTHRMIFNNKDTNDKMVSFSFPFVCLADVEVEQPVFGANYIKGKVRAQENGRFIGEAKFKLWFKSGGAIDFAKAMLRAAHLAKANSQNAPPPPYTPPTGDFYQAPPPAYAPNPTGYYGWLPNTQQFPNQPPANGVFMNDNPPPYPGIVPPPSYNAAGNYPGSQPGYPGGQAWGNPTNAGGPPGYPGNHGPPNYQSPPQPGYPSLNQTGYPPMGQPSFPTGQQSSAYTSPYPSPGQPSAGYPPMGQPNYPTAQQSSAYDPYPASSRSGSYPSPQSGYPPMSYPPAGGTGYPPHFSNGTPGSGIFNGPPGGASGGASNPMGFTAPSAPPPNSKEAEAAQSAYNNTTPQNQFAPPPSFYDPPPPSYNSLQQNNNRN